jgi:2-aminoadipate transaminase
MTPYPGYCFSRRIQATPRSMIREILKVTERPGIISFGGGLPSAAFLDAEGIGKAAAAVLRDSGRVALQYATTEGYLPLRNWIADRYHDRLGLSVNPDEILITNGSQQTLDLLGRIFIDEGTPVAIEAPGYLGAIQAFSQYMPEFHGIPLEDEGPDKTVLSRTLVMNRPVFFYAIPNSQNPSGITYSAQRRSEIASIIRNHDTLLIEDNAYGEIRFDGTVYPSFRSLLPVDQSLLCGSFSKIVAPGLRLGWLCAPAEVIDKAVIAKQASDLHSSNYIQRVLHQYLTETDIDAHISRITRAYGEQCSLMLKLIDLLFPAEIHATRPDGGMFIWLELPEGYSATELWRRALKQNVAIIPGTPFYTDGSGDRGIRLNFSNSDAPKIRTGIRRLAEVITEYMDRNRPDTG